MISFSRKVVNNQCSTASGNAGARMKLPRLGQGMKLEPDLVVAKAVAREVRPVDRMGSIPAVYNAFCPLCQDITTELESRARRGIGCRMGAGEALRTAVIEIFFQMGR